MVNIQGVCAFPYCTVAFVSIKYCHCVHLDELDLCTKEINLKYLNLSRGKGDFVTRSVNFGQMPSNGPLWLYKAQIWVFTVSSFCR